MQKIVLTGDIHIPGSRTYDQIINQTTCPELSDYGIEYTGLTDAQTPFHLARIKRDAAHLLFCSFGVGQVWVNGRWELCRPGEAYLSRRFAPFAFKALPKQKWQFAWVHYFKARSWHNLLPKESTRVAVSGLPLIAALTGLYRETMGRSQPIARKHWIGLIDYYWKTIGEANSEGGRLTMLWEKVDRTPNYLWTIKDLKKLSGLSHEHLRRISLKETGLSPMTHVTHLRMNRAMNLLQTTSLNIEAIGEAVGYATPFAFSAAFKRWAGVSPSKYVRLRD